MGALMCTTTLFAQKPGQKRQQPTPEQRIERQAARMDKELMLDDETSAKFLPLYKEYLQAMAECRPAPAERPRKSELSDEELDKRMSNAKRNASRRKKPITPSSRKYSPCAKWKRFSLRIPNVSTTRRTKLIALPATDASNMPLCPRICSCDDRI